MLYIRLHMPCVGKCNTAADVLIQTTNTILTGACICLISGKGESERWRFSLDYLCPLRHDVQGSLAPVLPMHAPPRA